MLSKNRIGGIQTAKRKIKVREYFQAKQKICFSDPFVDDESEVEKFALNFEPSKFSIHLRYSEPNNEKDDDIDPDGILIKPNLEEAEKFISSLNLHKKTNSNEETKKSYKYVETISKAEIDAFKKQCDNLYNLKMLESKEDSDPDEFLI